MQTDGLTPPKSDLSPERLSTFNDTLRAGIENKDSALIKLALANGAEPNILMFAGIAYKPGWLERVYAENHTGLYWVKLAVQSGADVNATNAACTTADGRPYTAIHCALHNFTEDVSDFLISKGASVDTPSPDNNTPLMRTIFHGQPELAKYYLKKGADPMRPCHANVFPLQELQKSDKFRTGKKSELVTLMMENVRTATPDSTPGSDFNAAAKDVGLAHDIDVQKPLVLKSPANKPQRHFEL